MFGAVLLALADLSQVRPYDAETFAFWILATIGLFGYAFEVELAPAAIWRPFSWAFACWLLLSAFTSLLRVLSLMHADANEQKTVLAHFGLPLTYAIDCFALIAVWRYAEKRTGGRISAEASARRGEALLDKLAGSSLVRSLQRDSDTG